MKKKLYDLMNRRTALIQQAEDALNANNHSGYQSAMEQITNLNQEITDIQADAERSGSHRQRGRGHCPRACLGADAGRRGDLYG